MEQEPVYVISDKLADVCHTVLGRIYEIRQTNKEQYMLARCADYNKKVQAKNKYRRYLKYLGVKPYVEIDVETMEQLVLEELQGLQRTNPQLGQNHPVVNIYGEYAHLEHMTKDCLIQCAMNESVPVSADMARGISHLGIPLTFMQKPRVGFIK